MVKKLAVLGDECKAIDNYFKNKDVEITAFSDINRMSGDFDLIALNNYTGAIPDNSINIHYSLLPAFAGEDEIKTAFLAGVKVSGVTIFYPNSRKIIAQYPVLIGNSVHFDEFEKEIRDLGNILYPIVIDKILKDEVFDDFSDLAEGCCSCSSCGGCRK